MKDKVRSYVEFLMKQIILFQESKNKVLKVNDTEPISKIVENRVSIESEKEEEYSNPLAYVIGNEIVNASLSGTHIEDRIDRASKEELKEFKSKLDVEEMLKRSPFLEKVRDSGTLLYDELLENIPAIYCYISNSKLKAIGYTKDGPEIIYEINKNDKIEYSKDIDLISLYDYFYKENSQTKK